MSKPRIAFFGTPEFSAQLLEHIIVNGIVEVACVLCQPDRPQGRTQKTLPPPVKVVAEKYGIPCFQPASVRKELTATTEFLQSHGPIQLTIVVAFGQILPVAILDLPEHGSCNVHASLLPRWRGAAPIQRAIQAGDQETGICLMRMDAGLDTGAVYVRDSLPIAANETFATLHNKLCALSKEMLAKYLNPIAAAEIPATAQTEEGLTYAQKILSEEAHIDWGKPALEIERMLRAFDPAPGAYSLLKGKRLKIFRGMLLGQSGGGNAGEVLAHDKSGLLVGCGDGATLLLQELQLEGKRRQNSHEFVNGLTIEKGVTLS